MHLRLHTEYSLLDGIVRVPELMAAVSAAGMPAVALTDQSNLFAMVKFYKEALAAGVKPLIGVDAWIREAGERAPPSRVVFLCQTLVGYRHLTQLVTRSFLEGQLRGAPMLERSWLKSDMLQGLIVLSGGAQGDIGQALCRGRDDEAVRCLTAWQELCGDRFYLEVQRTGRAGEEIHADAVMELAQERGVAALATNDVRFLTRAEFEAHEARVCIHDGALLADTSRARRYSEEQYLKSPAEMAELFRDAPELLDNTLEVAKRCSLEIRLGASMLPAYPVPAGSNTEDYLREGAVLGLGKRLTASQAAVADVELAFQPVRDLFEDQHPCGQQSNPLGLDPRSARDLLTGRGCEEPQAALERLVVEHRAHQTSQRGRAAADGDCKLRRWQREALEGPLDMCAELLQLFDRWRVGVQVGVGEHARSEPKR